MDAALDSSDTSGGTSDALTGQPPHELRDALSEEETLVWWSRGSGSTLEARDIFTFVLVVVFAIISAVHWFYLRDLFVIALAAALLLLMGSPILAKTIFGARWEIYGLSSERLIFIRNSWPRYCISFARNEASIGFLRVTGRTGKGRILLRGDFTLHRKSGTDAQRSGLVRLTGIAHPLKVADLIKNTLSLNTPIENRIRS